MNNSCALCTNDCDQYTQNERCQNYVKCRPIAEYLRIIKEQNRNLHKFCEEYNLKYNELMKMLRYKTRMKFKYRKCLETFLLIEDPWKDWIVNGRKLYGE